MTAIHRSTLPVRSAVARRRRTSRSSCASRSCGRPRRARCDAGAAMPQIVADAPGDRRFSSARLARAAVLRVGQAGVPALRRIPESDRVARELPAAEKRRLEFSVRQFVDAIAPTNFPATNPDVLDRALETDGASVVAGLQQLRRRHRQGPDHDERRVGIRARPQPRRHARQRRLPQRADRAHPVRRDDAEGRAGGRC